MSGGAGDWNGTVIRESVIHHPTDPGTGRDAHFDHGFTPQTGKCGGGSSWVVGEHEASTRFGCERPKKDNSFWDQHFTTQGGYPVTLLKDGQTPKTTNCQQTWFCNQTQLDGTFKIEHKFTNRTYTWGGMMHRVNEFESSKTRE